MEQTRYVLGITIAFVVPLARRAGSHLPIRRCLSWVSAEGSVSRAAHTNARL